jgi:hypothetical protein
MTAIHHQRDVQSRLAQFFSGCRGVLGSVIGAVPAAAQDNMAVGVAGGLDDAGHPLLVNSQKTVRSTSRTHGVNGRLDAAVRTVLKTDGHRQSTGHLPVRLRLSRAGANGRPADQVGDVLRDDGV